MNILVADDDRNFGFVLKSELEAEKHTIDLVPNGVEAVLNFVSKPYDFVLLDVKMPRLDGTDALKIMKRINPDVPVISFSGNAGPNEISRTLECGALQCLKKPFEVTYLKDLINSYFLK